MTISDETLMAFADGELDGATSQAVESAMRSDPELERRVRLHRALRMRLQDAFGAELSEPVPERLIMAARKTATPAPVNLQDYREAAAARRSARAAVLPWRRFGSMAASLSLGIGIGFLIWRGDSGSSLRESRGGVLAAGHLAEVLSNRLGSEPAADTVHLGISFIARSGEYCRTFSTAGERPAAGLACRSGGDWRIQALQSTQAGGEGGGYRTAGSGMPPQILSLVEAQIAGEPLDAQGEATGRDRHWQAR